MNQLPLFDTPKPINRAMAAYLNAKNDKNTILGAKSVTRDGRTTTTIEYYDGTVEVVVEVRKRR